MSQRIDIGHGHSIEYFVNPETGERYGLTLWHPRPGGGECGCSVFWAGRAAPIWRATSIEPLTLEPSVQCLQCGDHGFIREGRWVPHP